MDKVIIQLTNTLSDSSLNSLFKQTYDATIGEMKKSFAQMQNQAKEDHNTYKSTSSLQTAEYNSMKSKFESQTILLNHVQSTLSSLIDQVHSYDQKVTSFTNRYDWLHFIE